MQRLAAALLAYAANDLLSGRDTQEILAWIDGAPALIPFAVCCQLAGIEAERTRLRLQQAAQDPGRPQGRAQGVVSADVGGVNGSRSDSEAHSRSSILSIATWQEIATSLLLSARPFFNVSTSAADPNSDIAIAAS